MECNMDIVRQTACLDFNPVIVKNYAFLWNSTTAGRVSDIKQIIFYSLRDHLAYSVYFENHISLKPILKGRIQSCKLDCCV